MRRWLAGALLVTVGWLASPSAVPVYDGVGAPDQPYRYVGRSPAPVVATLTAATSSGSSASVHLASKEVGPQVLVDLAAGAFTAPGSTMTLTATPLAPDGRPPRGSIDGNVYRITASSGAVLHADLAQGFLFLRAAVMTTPDPVVVHRATPSDPWTQVRTARAGRDVMSTPFRVLGDYAVVRLPGSKPLGSGGLSTTRVLVLVGGVLLLVVVTVLVLRRPRQEDGTD